MTTATIAKPSTKAAAKADNVTDPAVLLDALRTRWALAEKSELDTFKAREAADIAWQNARVIKVRVAYAAAMVKPEKGAANLLNAARILLTDPADTAAERTKAAKSKKNTLRNYVDAGTALDAAGLANRTTEPDAEERKIVAAVFREGNKRDKSEAKEAKEATTAAETGDEQASTAIPDPLTIADLAGHIGRLQSTLKLMQQAAVPVSEEEAAHIESMLGDFMAELSAYAAS